MNNNVQVIINNQKKVVVPYKTTIMNLVLNNQDICSDKIIGAKINNEIADFSRCITKDTNIEFFDINSIDGYKMNQAGLKFVLEVALKDNFSRNAEVYFDHSIGNGIHVTIKNYLFHENECSLLKKYMDEIINKDEKIIKLNVESKEAVEFYKKMNLVEKANNIHNLSGRIIVMYKLRNHFNYLYSEMPYSTGYLNNFELKYINENEIAIVLPINHTFNLVEYKNYEKITKCFKDNINLLKLYKMPYISDINKIVSLGQSRNLIRLFETNFDSVLYETCQKIIEKKAKYILLSGPSSSGKTTTSKKLALNLQAKGFRVLLISTDDYFVNRSDSPKKADGTYDFESINCIDIPKFNQDLKDLIAKKEVRIPSYNFVTGLREYNLDPIRLDDNSIILIEGIHCLNDQLTQYLDNNLKYKIYLSPFMPVKMDRHNYISTTDLRLLRRIIRDNNNRNASILKTLELWSNVRMGEEENIFPYVDSADVIVNTALPYELGVLKVFAEPLLYSVTNDSAYLEEARRLIKIFDNIYPISSEYVEEDSILREFIGGSVFKKEGDK